MEERKSEEFETELGEWKVYFDFGDKLDKESCVEVRFGKIKDHLSNEDIKNLKQDIKDLGKFRIIKRGREFLEK